MKMVSFHLINPSACVEFLVESKAILFERRKYIYRYVHIIFVYDYACIISEQKELHFHAFAKKRHKHKQCIRQDL